MVSTHTIILSFILVFLNIFFCAQLPLFLGKKEASHLNQGKKEVSILNNNVSSKISIIIVEIQEQYNKKSKQQVFNFNLVVYLSSFSNILKRNRHLKKNKVTASLLEIL